MWLIKKRPPVVKTDIPECASEQLAPLTRNTEKEGSYGSEKSSAVETAKFFHCRLVNSNQKNVRSHKGKKTKWR